MANPQTEKGYTRVANEILMQIMTVNLNGTQFRIVMAIWRYTYGFQRKGYKMPLDFIAELIDSNKGQVKKALDPLIQRNIIIATDDNSKGGRILSFNKNYEEWDSGVKTAVQPEPAPKKPKKPAKPKKYDDDNTYFKMAVYFHQNVSVVAKEAGIEHLIAKANLQSWADDFRKLIELDKVDKRLAKNVMDWVIQDSFWRTNILSAKKLREKFTKLAIKMKASSTPKQQPKPRDSRNKDIEFQKWVSSGKNPGKFNWE